MTDKHSQSFFGQSTGLIIQSSSKNEPYIFLSCIKRKPDGVWEKPSIGEGKTIRCSLDELVMILRVLNRKINSWSGYHTYKENNTPISFSWENSEKDKLWINIGNYSKMLGVAQIEIFKLLLKHLIKERIEFATVSNISQKQEKELGEQQIPNILKSDNPDSDRNTIIDRKLVHANRIKEDRVEINGSIKAETEKALLIVFTSGQELWFPKSIIHSQYDSEVGKYQSFITENWILEKNKVQV